MDQKQKIMEKILKLLDLGDAERNSNDNEREVAMNHAAKLMAEYSIDFQELRLVQEKDATVFTKVDIEAVSNVKDLWEGALALAITDAFDCLCINKRGNSYRICFVGTKHDVEIALFFFQYLRRTVDKMAEMKVKPNGRSRSAMMALATSRRSYRFGMVDTIRTRMKELYAKRAEFIPVDCRDLMIVKGNELKNFFKREFPNATTVNRAVAMDNNARQIGRADGYKVNLSRPIGHTGATTRAIGQ